MMTRTRVRLVDDFPHKIARVGLSQRAFAKRSGVALSTIKGLINPEQARDRRGGGMHLTTAWKIAKAYAAAAGIDEQQAFEQLLVEEPITEEPIAEEPIAEVAA
jgi:transcriptional regulator with XRE-family HTH domain